MIDSVSDHDIDNFVINVEDCSAMSLSSLPQIDGTGMLLKQKGREQGTTFESMT